MIKTKPEITQKVGLRNEFTFKVTEFTDKTCTKIKSETEYKAYNTILDQGIEKVLKALNYSTAVYSGQTSDFRMMRGADVDEEEQYRIGGAIHYGTGTTAPDPTDTELETYLGGKASTYYARGKEAAYAYYTQTVSILPAEHIGSDISEVGLAASDTEPTTTNKYLSTHARIVNAGGTPIAITKTATMQIEIYAKFFIILGTISYNNTAWVNGIPPIQFSATETAGNALIELVYCNLSISRHKIVSGVENDDKHYVVSGTDETAPVIGDGAVKTYLAKKKATTSYSLVNKKFTYTARFEISESNGKLKEIGTVMNLMGGEFDHTGHDSQYAFSLFRTALPATSLFTSSTFTAENIGTGDGTEKDFTLTVNGQLFNEISSGTLSVYVDGVLQTVTTDYTYNDTTGTISFNTAPPNTEAVTATWTLPYCAKDSEHVFDIDFSLVFSEGSDPT